SPWTWTSFFQTHPEPQLVEPFGVRPVQCLCIPSRPTECASVCCLFPTASDGDCECECKGPPRVLALHWCVRVHVKEFQTILV
uniref:Uncharacterized protein n=1 Tax=Anopheles quadriannulatus TaxID=34691 RepID=A0A182XSR0_ANOQN